MTRRASLQHGTLGVVALLIAGACSGAAAQGLPNPVRTTGFSTAVCVPPDGGSVTARDIDICSASGIRIEWAADPGYWYDDNLGTRSYDIRRNNVLIASHLEYETTTFEDHPPAGGQFFNYTVVYRNGCGATGSFGASARDVDQSVLPAPPAPANPVPADGSTICRSTAGSDLQWVSPLTPGQVNEVFLDDQSIGTGATGISLASFGDGPHSWYVVSRLCGDVTTGPTWSFTVGPSAETCDGQDNNCDGEVDEEITRPCLNDCHAGVEACVAGQWLGCTATPCCDTTLGPGGAPGAPVDLCPAAAVADRAVCLLPGSYAVGAGCQVRSSLVGLDSSLTTRIEGDLRLTTPVSRVQGVTITGLLQSEFPVDLLDDDIEYVSLYHNDTGFGFRLSQIIGNRIGDLDTALPAFVYGNRLRSAFLQDEKANFQSFVANRVQGAIESALRIDDTLVAYVTRNQIEDAPVGIRVFGSSSGNSLGGRIVGNLLQGVGIGIDVSDSDNTQRLILRNAIEFTGDRGIRFQGSYPRIENNLVWRRPGAPAGGDPSVGIEARLYHFVNPGCTWCDGRLSGNTIVGADIGARVIQDWFNNAATLTGNLVVGAGEVGVHLCGFQCQGPPAFPVTLRDNDVFDTPTPWSGVPDPSGSNGNISADPRFADAAAGDFSLAGCSPAIDASAEGLLFTDLTGDPRSIDGDGDGASIADMGALERLPLPGDPGPGQDEVCDLIDNDCDDAIDEGGVCEQRVFDLTASKVGPPDNSRGIVRWSTTHEIDLRGFNIFEVGPQGRATKVNASLIGCLECTSGRSGVYYVAVARHRSSRNLYVQMVHTDGTTEIFGPATREK